MLPASRAAVSSLLVLALLSLVQVESEARDARAQTDDALFWQGIEELPDVLSSPLRSQDPPGAIEPETYELAPLFVTTRALDFPDSGARALAFLSSCLTRSPPRA